MFVSVTSGPWDDLFGGGNLPAFIAGAVAAVASGVLALFMLPSPPADLPSNKNARPIAVGLHWFSLALLAIASYIVELINSFFFLNFNFRFCFSLNFLWPCGCSRFCIIGIECCLTILPAFNGIAITVSMRKHHI